MEPGSEEDLMRRALSAYYRSGATQMPGSGSAVRAVGGLKYVHLCGGGETLAVYRVDSVGRLKRLKRWPADLNRFA